MKANLVPCNGCTLCCQGEVIELVRGVDRVNDYQVKRFHGAWVLDHKPNGDCVYLDRATGCTIWQRRPALCRDFDCRTVRETQLGVSRRIFEQGQKLLEET